MTDRYQPRHLIAMGIEQVLRTVLPIQPKLPRLTRIN
jgi:hypothetical protein